ncbi:MBL fold metallo-hydrolase [Streptomyces misionensis]|uniref:MBL fold metallo-hydrolase n=1 Tax=Streptomyces misionensis TaxID=67331 RepID=A0A5C6J1T2_9ACTN|nr:MBL fold metallo-hydrolase [Streptomyces misionensis]
MRLGEHTITVLTDGGVQLHPLHWFPDSVWDDWSAPGASPLDGTGHIPAPITALLVEHRDRSLLIDSGYGAHSVAAEDTIATIGGLYGGQLPAELARHGREGADVDTVAFTHLHDDHVGWAFGAGPDAPRLFSRATFVASAAEWATGEHRAGEAVTRAVDPGEEFFPGVRAWATPGHTNGHTAYVISAGGRRLIAFGDVFHVPDQIARPGWTCAMDALPEQAVRTRHAMVAELIRPDTLAFATHFPAGPLGQVRARGGIPRWTALDA